MTRYHVHGMLTHCGKEATWTITVETQIGEDAQAFALDCLGEVMNCEVVEVEKVDE